MTLTAMGSLLLRMLLRQGHQTHNRSHLEEFFRPLLPLLIQLAVHKVYSNKLSFDECEHKKIIYLNSRLKNEDVSDHLQS